MATSLTGPYGKGSASVPDELVERFKAAGWTTDAPKRQTRKTRVTVDKADDTSTDDE